MLTPRAAHRDAPHARKVTEHKPADVPSRDTAVYGDLFERSPLGIVVIDAETGKTIDANPAACGQLGYTREEFSALSISDYEASESPEETQAHVRHVRSTGSDEFETLQRTKGGEIRNVHVWARTMQLQDQTVFYCIYEDVTARAQAERALQDSEADLSEAESIAGFGSFVTDFSTGFWKSSRELDRIFGIDDRYVRSVDGWLALVHPEWRDVMTEYLTNDVLGRRITFDKEYRIVRPSDHQARWVHGLGRLVLDERGEPVKMRGTIQDITDRRMADESRLLQSAALMATAIPMVITDREGTIAWVNSAFAECTGYSAEEAVGRKPGQLLKSGVHDRAFYKQLWDTVLAGEVWRGEMTNRRKDGTLYPEVQTITPVRDAQGRISHFVAVKRDLTNERQLEAQFLQAQKMESVGRLAGGIAHDFNNLLSVIIGWTEIAISDLPKDHEVRPPLDEVLKASQGAAALTRQLLAFSRRQVVESTVFNPNDLVDESKKMFRRLIGDDIEFITREEPDLGTVKMNRGQLEQVLMNLVVNARDAMPEGGRLTLATANVSLDADAARDQIGVTPGDFVMIVVSDSGTGMSDEVKAHIFEPFYTTKEHGKGTGLGLATCYGIVKHAGGHIVVDSKPGLGTSFSVFLPQSGETEQPARRPRSRIPTHGIETILIVEDVPALCLLTERMLLQHGYHVLSARSGEEALRLVERHAGPLHLLLTDIVLGNGLNGIKLAERVRFLRPETRVLFTSGYTSDVISLYDLLEQGHAFIPKPFSTEALGRKVREVLDAT